MLREMARKLLIEKCSFIEGIVEIVNDILIVIKNAGEETLDIVIVALKHHGAPKVHNSGACNVQ